MMISKTFPALLQTFFTDRLLRQWRASPHTVASYRDSFRLLLRFAKENLDKEPSVLSFEDFTADFLSEFLDYVEKDRGNSVRTRNTRLTAIHSFFRYVSFSEPACADLCCQILAIPSKRFEKRPIEFLTPEEINALLDAPDKAAWIGRRDRTLLLTAIQTGLRVSELISLRCDNVVLGTGAHVRCEGKGRKQRCTPLRPETGLCHLGFVSLMGSQIIQSFPTFAVVLSAETQSNAWLPDTAKPHRYTASPLSVRKSHLMCFVTPLPWNYFDTGWIVQ